MNRTRLGTIASALIVLTTAVACGAPEPLATPRKMATPTLTPQPPLAGSGGGVIAFASDRDGNDEIFLMNADGTDPRQLTYTSQSIRSSYPAWSPDGLQIAFQTESAAGHEAIQVMDWDGTDLYKLTTKRNARQPAWSPDGGQIAFNSWNGRNTAICTAMADGSEEQCLTSLTPDTDFFGPSWSPDGSQIACAVHSHPGSQDLGYRIHILDVVGGRQDAEGDNVRRLSLSGEAAEDIPTWSPASVESGPSLGQIAFTSVRDGQWQLFLVNANGTDLRQLTHDSADHLHPAWSPDGSKIAYQANPDGHWDIFVLDIQAALERSGGNGVQRVTNSAANDWCPSWRP